MAESAVPKVPRDGVLTIKDGTGTPVTYTVQYSDAVAFTNTQTAAIHVYNRGTRVYTRARATRRSRQSRLMSFSQVSPTEPTERSSMR